jgi:hypothetical protein
MMTVLNVMLNKLMIRMVMIMKSEDENKRTYLDWNHGHGHCA